MSEQLDVLKLVAEQLHRADIAYMISGSMALNYYAQPRLTRDAAESRSEIQLQDVRNLIRSVAHLDWTYIERWADELTVGELLREVRG